MKQDMIIHMSQTVSSVEACGGLGLSGTYLIVAEVIFMGELCFVIKDWDGEGENTHIVSQDYFTEEYMDVVQEVHNWDMDRWNTHPDQVPQSRKDISKWDMFKRRY